MKVSIVMATYNGSLYLKEQIESILSQSFQDFEIVACDDCSSDGTWSILEHYALLDHRFRIIRNEKNMGFIRNFEKGILLSEGDYIALCDQDDIWSNDHLEVLLNIIGEKMMSAGDAEIIDKNGNPIGILLSETTGISSFPTSNIRRAMIFIFNQNLIQGASMLLRREFLSIALPIPAGVKYHDEWFSLLACFSGGISYTTQILNYYRKHGQNVTSIANSPKNVYNHYLYRIKKDCISYKEEMVCEIEKRVNSLNRRDKAILFLCKKMLNRNKSLMGRIMNGFIKIPFFKVIYQKTSLGLFRVLLEFVKYHINVIFLRCNRIIPMMLSKIWYSFYRRDNNLWVFGEWFGERCCDNCFYFANFVAQNYPEKKVIWIYKEGSDISHLDNNVCTCIMDSKEANSYLKKAGVVFMNQSINDFVSNNLCYYAGSLVVNFWHGIPWKKISYDIPNSLGDLLYIKIINSISGGKLYLSTSDSFSKIWNTALKINDSDIIKAGYPRNRLLYNDTYCLNSRKLLSFYLKEKGVIIDDSTKIISYLPTFRDRQKEVFSFEEIMNNKTLIEILTKYNAIIIQKSHYISSHRKPYQVLFDNLLCIIEDYPTQKLLAASDILITDYSSCFFDFLLLDRPIIHYLYDYDYYSRKDRTLYYTKEEVCCGDIADNKTALINAIESNLNFPDKNCKLRKQRREKYLQYENPNSCSIIYKNICRHLSS